MSYYQMMCRTIDWGYGEQRGFNKSVCKQDKTIKSIKDVS